MLLPGHMSLSKGGNIFRGEAIKDEIISEKHVPRGILSSSKMAKRKPLSSIFDTFDRLSSQKVPDRGQNVKLGSYDTMRTFNTINTIKSVASRVSFADQEEPDKSEQLVKDLRLVKHPETFVGEDTFTDSQSYSNSSKGSATQLPNMRTSVLQNNIINQSPLDRNQSQNILVHKNPDTDNVSMYKNEEDEKNTNLGNNDVNLQPKTILEKSPETVGGVYKDLEISIPIFSNQNGLEKVKGLGKGDGSNNKSPQKLNRLPQSNEIMTRRVRRESSVPITYPENAHGFMSRKTDGGSKNQPRAEDLEADNGIGGKFNKGMTMSNVETGKCNRMGRNFSRRASRLDIDIIRNAEF